MTKPGGAAPDDAAKGGPSGDAPARSDRERPPDWTAQAPVEYALNELLRQSQKREEEVSALLKSARAVLEYREFADASRAIFDSCKTLIGAASGYVALLSQDGAENEVLFLDSGGLPCSVDPALPMPIRGLRETAYRTCKPAYHNDFSRSDWVRFLPQGHVQLDNVLFSPLVVEGKAVGLLGIANKPGGFDDHDARMAAAFGELAAIALLNSRMLESLEKSEQALRAAQEQLETKVHERTAELARANRALKGEITERRRLEKEILRVSSEEQQRIGQELHDGLGQQLLGLGMMAKGLEKTLEAKSPSEADCARRITRAMVEAQEHVRAIIKGVRPVDVDANGLMAALAELAGSTEKLAEIRCTFACKQPVPIEDNHTATQLFYIAAEAVRNAVKHARAKQVVIGLDSDGDGVKLSVRDDGVGIRVDSDQAAGMGLRIMRHRTGVLGARLEIESVDEGGTLVTCTLPQDG
jgi:signal transduction histidine kinase